MNPIDASHRYTIEPIVNVRFATFNGFGEERLYLRW